MLFVCHTRMQQHYRQSKRDLVWRKKELTDRLASGWQGGKAVALYGKKQKLNHMTESAIWYPGSNPAPHSVCENFISCLFCKPSQQEKCSSHAYAKHFLLSWSSVDYILMDPCERQRLHIKETPKPFPQRYSLNLHVQLKELYIFKE